MGKRVFSVDFSLSRDIILRRLAANFLVLCLLASSAYAVVLVGGENNRKTIEKPDKPRTRCST